MKLRRITIALVPAVALALTAASAPPPPPAASVPYPDGYRGWAHVKTLVLQQGHPLYDMFGGMHHVYANPAALKALESSSRPFPDGSVFVFDLLEAKAGDGAIAEGPRKIVGVMHKNAKTFAATGGWGFEGFKGDGRDRAVTDGGASCHACHLSQEKNDLVFSAWRK